MAMAPLRCHLLISQPASGKTTLAKSLAPLLTAPSDIITPGDVMAIHGVPHLFWKVAVAFRTVNGLLSLCARPPCSA